MRPPLSREEIERIRRDRLTPRLTHPHYLHLRAIRRGLTDSFAELELPAGPALDLYCGTQPYRDLLGERIVVGVDIDMHFGSADVVADIPLPFGDAAFAVGLCTQTLYLLDDDAAVVAEMRRVLMPGGRAVVSVPHLWRREGAPMERRYRARDLERLFSTWSDVSVTGTGGLGTGGAYHAGSLAAALERRMTVLRPLVRATTAVVNVCGVAIDWITRPLARRWPAVLIVVARR